MISKTKILSISVASTIFLLGCGKTDDTGSIAASVTPNGDSLLTTLAPSNWADAASSFIDPEGNQIGYAVFKNAPRAGVLIRVDIAGLSEGWHGIHLHQVADCSDGAEGFKASGGHIDPDDRAHGLLNPDGPERADIPNIYAGPDGRATAEIFNTTIALYPSEAAAAEAGPYPLMDEDGFAMVVHTSADDHMTQPIGGAGARVACAAIKTTN